MIEILVAFVAAALLVLLAGWGWVFKVGAIGGVAYAIVYLFAFIRWIAGRQSQP